MKFLITFLFFIINNFILNLNALKSDFHVEVVPKEHSWNIKIFCQECLNEKYKKVLPKDYVGTTFTLEHEEGISGLHVVIKSTEKILGHQRSQEWTLTPQQNNEKLNVFNFLKSHQFNFGYFEPNEQFEYFLKIKTFEHNPIMIPKNYFAYVEGFTVEINLNTQHVNGEVFDIYLPAEGIQNYFTNNKTPVLNVCVYMKTFCRSCRKDEAIYIVRGKYLCSECVKKRKYKKLSKEQLAGMCHTIKNPILQNGENPQFEYIFDLNDKHDDDTMNYAELIEFEGGESSDEEEKLAKIFERVKLADEELRNQRKNEEIASTSSQGGNHEQAIEHPKSNYGEVSNHPTYDPHGVGYPHYGQGYTDNVYPPHNYYGGTMQPQGMLPVHPGSGHGEPIESWTDPNFNQNENNYSNYEEESSCTIC